MQGKAPPARKRAINLTVDAELLAEAKAARINVSALLERALRGELKAYREAAWKEQNRAAIEASNAYFEKHGLPLAKLRTW